jgi:hypothetical protein
MTMHLEGPWLSTTGKRKGKQKFRTAAEARKARELAQEWEERQRAWTSVKPFSGHSSKSTKPVQNHSTPKYVRDTGPRIPSLNGGVDMVPALKTPEKVYTGTKIIGIGTMHKSNAVPIFSDNEAKEISSMRR